MAKKAASQDRTDPKQNKSLAIRTVLRRNPDAKAVEVADAVREEFGHDVSINMVYLVKAKTNARKGTRTESSRSSVPTDWIESIKAARQLIRSTGSVESATALLKVLGD
jgi:hypothetical protein